MSNIDRALPLVENHRHLDGNLRLETILDLGRLHGIPLPAWDVEELRPYVQVSEPQPGLMAFIAKFEWMIKVLADAEACRRVAYENVVDAHREGIDHIELRFSPWFMAEAHHLAPESVVEAVVDGVEAGARDCGISVGLIGILSRTYGPEIAWRELEALLTQRDHLVALDLAGDEANMPGDLFVSHFRHARDAGLQVTVHAGEAAGPESVWQAIEALGAVRLGHAVHAVEDPLLLDTLAERRIGLEENLTSNIQTSTIASYRLHPIRTFLEHGACVSLNTDDPSISGIDLAHEYDIAAPAAGLTKAQLRRVQLCALEMAFLSEDEKAALRVSKAHS